MADDRNPNEEIFRRSMDVMTSRLKTIGIRTLILPLEYNSGDAPRPHDDERLPHAQLIQHENALAEIDWEASDRSVFVQTKHLANAAQYLEASIKAAVLLEFSKGRVVEESPSPRVRYRPSILLDMLVPMDRAQDMHANLEELFPLWVVRHGMRKAAWIKNIQVGILIGGTWWEKFLSITERVLKSLRLIGS